MCYNEIFQKLLRFLLDCEYSFNLKDNMSYLSKPYPIPIKYRDKVQAEINKWLELGIVSCLKTPYISPLEFVIKKDRSVLPCIDVRKLNE